ncbi:hypothetical protein KT71_001375 [Congregibacter litoralis KT71]|uniref:Uncharacterized protein n=2 Tax=Congregibacter TaxID=393661 RepID=V7HRW4_9GAMM|nr:hypothetical protein KT71_001375 [Congregibacter litoralis KT71]
MGFVGFILDTCARHLIGLRVSTNMRTGLVLTTLDRAICARGAPNGVVHGEEMGSHYVGKLRFGNRDRR